MLSWNYDYKITLLGKNYVEDEPIQNILKGKDEKYYTDDNNDYFLYERYKRGHIENYNAVEEIFRRLLNHRNNTYKDVMNSFWITYKSFLQIEYPEVFMPDGKLNEDTPPLQKPKGIKNLTIKYPPHETGSMPQKYIDYYNKYFKMYQVRLSDTWVDFLLNNFNNFDDVHASLELNEFAKLTHTIGNITVVPKGFNSGRNAYDYWDWGLIYLKEFLTPINAWYEYIDIYYLNGYVDDDYKINEFWDNHLVKDTKLLPQNRYDIERYLEFVNRCIEERGEKIMEKIS